MNRLFVQMRANRTKRAALSKQQAQKNEVELSRYEVARRDKNRDVEQLRAEQSHALLSAAIAAHKASHFAATDRLPELLFSDAETGVIVWRE